MDNLDAILAGYDKPANVVSDPAQPQPQPQAPANDQPMFPGETVPPKQGFSITHNPAGSDPKLEYYVRGPKKGQLKPSKKNSGTSSPNSNVKPTSIQASTLLTGAMFITMIDLILPMGFCALHNWQFPDAKIDARDLKMKDYQRNELAPIADAVAREMNINASPVVLLLVGIVGIYGLNMMTLHNEAVAKAKIAKKNEQAKKDSAKTTAENHTKTVPFIPN